MNNKTYIPVSLKSFTIPIPEIGRLPLINILLSILPFIYLTLQPITTDQTINSVLGLTITITIFILLFPSPFTKNKSIFNTIYIYSKRNKGINKYD